MIHKAFKWSAPPAPIAGEIPTDIVKCHRGWKYDELILPQQKKKKMLHVFTRDWRQQIGKKCNRFTVHITTRVLHTVEETNVNTQSCAGQCEHMHEYFWSTVRSQWIAYSRRPMLYCARARWRQRWWIFNRWLVWQSLYTTLYTQLKHFAPFKSQHVSTHLAEQRSRVA